MGVACFMSELDEKKLEIDFLQKQFFVALAVMFALLGWMASNYTATNNLIIGLAFVAFFFSVGFVVIVHKKIIMLIREVKEL
jgi:ABC-type multidrug transport system permease subunit